ncbi:MAG TPA: hypothetical protein VK148_13475 [Xanthobacteraceae bacterium]|jgi:hypothetical protein|nr:hypothetical protein [Xanthobacteraceae bacterium]
MRKSLAAVIAFFCAATSASAEGSSQGYGLGGNFKRFDPVVAGYSQTGELFRITGHCQSACTLFLGIRNVCIEPSAQLLFHAGHDRNRNPVAWSTDHMLNAYNSGLRNYLVSNAYMSTPAFHTISGRDMIQKFGYRACSGRGA